MTSRWLVSGGSTLIVAMVTSCAGGSPRGTVGSSAEAPRSQSAGHSATAAPSSRGPAATKTKRPDPCRTHELGARFQAGGYGTGNDFGSIEIWNPGPAPCRLAGTVTFTALFADGTTDLKAVPNRPLPRLSVTLPAHMIRPREGTDQSGYLTALMMGPERDDPTQLNGLCRPRDELTPAVLVLSIGSVTLRIRNHDVAAPASRGISRAVYGCHGQVLLEDLAGPQAQ